MGPGRRLALTVGSWLAVGLVSGVQVHVASGLGPAPVGLDRALRLQVLAAAPWIPITYAALALAAAWPVAGPRWVPRLVLHLAVGAAAVVALNLAIFALQAVGAPAGQPPDGVIGPAMRGVLAQGHLALLVWGGLVAAGHARPMSGNPRREGSAAGAAGAPPGADPLALRDHRGTVLLPPSSIRWIQADGDYARVHTRDGSEHVVSARMAELERRLDAHGFARVHRSAIVNLARVRRHFARSHGDHVLELDDGARVPLPRGRREAVLARLPPRRK